jgi:uncharacterized protein YjdB
VKWKLPENNMKEPGGYGMFNSKCRFSRFIVLMVIMSLLLSQSYLSALAATTVNAKKITLDKKNITLEIGKTQILKATVTPSNTTNKKVKWSSSDTDIATVTVTGKVIAVEAGRTIITAKTSNGKKAMCKVTVKENEPTDIELVEEDITLDIEDSYTLEVSIEPTSASDAELSWSSDDEDVVSVDDEGNLFPMNEGTAIITVETANRLSDSCTVTITENVVDEATIEATVELADETFALIIGDKKRLIANIITEEAIDNKITWESSNTEIVTVDSNGYVKAVNKGLVTITATLPNGEYDECQVMVASGDLQASGIYIDIDRATLNVDESIILTAAIDPVDATDQNVTWSSSNDSLASVDAKGKVTAKAEGSVKIIATLNNNLSVSCTITIKTKTVAVNSVALSQENITLNVIDSTTLSTTIYPEDATDKTITWQSSNSNIASVDPSGNIYALAKGTTTITAKSTNGKVDSCQVNVSESLTNVTLKDAVYKLTLKGTNICLDVNGGVDKNGANVQAWESNDTNAQKWKFENHSDGTISLISQCAPDKVLDVMRTNNSTTGELKAGCNVDIYIHNDAPAQNFSVYQCSDGSYILRLSSNSDVVLTSTGTGNSANVIVDNYNENNILQKWTITETTVEKQVDTTPSFALPTTNAFQITVLSYYWGSAAEGKHVTKGGGTILGAMDISGPSSDIVSAEAGTVVAVGYDSGWGNNVTIKHDNGFYSFYAHMQNNSVTVSVGSNVVKGQKIGVMGSTGNSTGNHLHFEIWDSNKNTCETWLYFRENYKSQLRYDSDVVQGGSNPESWRTWITSNCKLSGGSYVPK